MGGKSRPAPIKKTSEEKAAEKAAKALEKAQKDFLKDAKQGDVRKIAKGLDAGVHIDQANEKGQTAAHYAAAFGHRKLLQFLHERGADFSLETKDSNKFTPLTAARSIGEVEAAELIEKLLAGIAVDVIDEEDSEDDGDDIMQGSSGVSPSGQLVSTSSKGRRRQGQGPVSATPKSLGTDSAEHATPPPSVDTAPFVAERSEEIDRSESDQRCYRWLKLTNQMQVMLISDPSCEYAAAAMNVGVGSSSDPENLPGLAHFVEHMLFLGTSKYPKEDDYIDYLEQHGGLSNAFTAHEDTHYYFDVQWPFLHGALDRFAQFFLCPLFTPSATERELKAIESEFAKNKQSDAWRVQQLTRGVANPSHPWSRFNAGNLESLSDQQNRAGRLVPPDVSETEATTPRASVRDGLLAFHKTHYSANLMALAVLGRESLDDLEQLVAPLFSAVVNTATPRPAWPSAPPFPDDRLGQRFHVVSVKEASFLTVVWPIPTIWQQYLSKSFRYVSHILGHEGEGSLLSLLKRRGWAEELLAGETQSHSDFATFEVTITLTELGNLHPEDIVEMVYACVRMIAEVTPPPRQVFDEIGDVSRMRLRFLEPVEPSQAVLHASQAMLQVLPRHAIVASFLYDEWRPDLIAGLLDRLRPERMYMVHLSPIHAKMEVALQTEPWYGTQYHRVPISEELFARCRNPAAFNADELRWPDPNPFIPTDFALLADEEAATSAKGDDDSTATDVVASAPAPESADTFTAALAARGSLVPPSLLRDDALCEVWHKVDLSFRRPKTNFYLDVVSSAAYDCPANAILTGICLRLVNDELAEFAYPAEIAGLTYMVQRHTTGFYVIVEGQSHKLPLLVGRVISRIANPSLTISKFEEKRELELRALRSWFRASPREHARYASDHLLDQSRWHVLEYLAFLEGRQSGDGQEGGSDAVPHDALLTLHKALCSRVRVTALCHGNTAAVEAARMAAYAVAALGGAVLDDALSESQLPDPRCLQLPAGKEVVLRSHRSLIQGEMLQSRFNEDETNSAVEVTLQAELGVDPHSSACVELLAAILSNPCFEELRTREQLGYLVELGVKYTHGVYGLKVTVQSSTHNPEHLDKRIEAFLATARGRVAQLDAAAFSNYRDALVTNRLSPPRTLQEESSLLWSEISKATYDFKREEVAAKAIASLTQADLCEYWEKHFEVGAEERRKLSSHAYPPCSELPPRQELGISGSQRIYLDGFDEALAFKRTLPPFPPQPSCPKVGPQASENLSSKLPEQSMAA